MPPLKSKVIEDLLLKRQVSLDESDFGATFGWERERGRGNYFSFGDFRLVVRRSRDGTKEEVVIIEDCSSISTRVWDCSVLTVKWFEKNLFSPPLSLISPSESLIDRLRIKFLDDRTDTNKSSDSVSNYRRTIQVLELGSGSGLLSICLAKMGTNVAVMSTEYGASVLYLENNVRQNSVNIDYSSNSSSLINTTTLIAGRICCRELNWYKTKDTLQTLFPKKHDVAIFDLIVVTDCSLSDRDSEGVLQMIRRFGSPGTIVVVGLCKEREGTPYFIEMAKVMFTEYLIVPQTTYHEDYQSSRHEIMLISV